MSIEEMLTRHVNIKVVDSYKEAPDYKGTGAVLLQLKQMIVVGKGCASGAPSVDLQLTDINGNEYVVMATGGIIEALGAAVRGKRERDEEVRNEA